MADKMAWFRRNKLNVRSDIAFYVHQEGENDTYDDNFDFVSLSLLVDKFCRLASAFNNASRLCAIDFSAPVGFNCTVSFLEIGIFLTFSKLE